MKLSKGKYQVVPSGMNNAMHEHSVWTNWKENSSAEKKMEGPGGQEIEHEPEYALETKDNSLLGHTRNSTARRQRGGNTSTPLSAAGMSTP